MSNTQTYEWPTDFPIDVPSKEAKPAKGYVYRLVSNVPPTLGDFNAYRKDRPDRDFKKN